MDKTGTRSKSGSIPESPGIKQTSVFATKTYDKDKDQQIFALGDAALQLDNINLDDLFSSFRFDQGLGNGAIPSLFEAHMGQTDPSPDQGDAKATVTEFNEQLGDGTQVHTKIIDGSTYKAQSTYVTKSGASEIKPIQPIVSLPKLKLSQDQEVENRWVEQLKQQPKPKRGSGSYDNVRSKYGPLNYRRSDCTEDITSLGGFNNQNALSWEQFEDAPPFPVEPGDISRRSSHVVDKPQPTEGQLSSASPPAASTPQELSRNRSVPRPDFLRSFSNGTESSRAISPTSPCVVSQPESNEETPNIETGSKYKYSIQSFGDDDIQWYKPHELQPQNKDDHGDTVSLDMGCLSCELTPFLSSVNKTKKQNKKKQGSPKGGAKMCMIMGGLQNEKSLPGLQSLVANYAKMLYKDRPQFLETMFRAVKLNKVDVIKILCKIIQKSGLKLHEKELREPESSATILHVALLYNHVETIDFLLEMKDPDLILAKYETDEYHNQTGLHVAVANGDAKVIEKLLLALQGPERQVLINTIADGHYFRKRHPHGQLCLTAAAWAGHCDVVKLLVKYGGNLALQNDNGNTLLHSIIRQSATSPNRHDFKVIFDTIWEAAYVRAETLNYNSKNAEHRKLQVSQMQVDIFKNLLTIRNEDGYTPLALATVTMSPLLQHMLTLDRIYKIPQSKLGSIAWVTYDVTEITSFADKKYNKFSLLHILAHSGKLLSRGADPNLTDDVDAFSLEPIRTILEKKWSVYRLIYIFWCLIHLLYMVSFTACTIEANSSPLFTKTVLKKDHSFDVKWWLIIFTILPVVYILLELLDLFGNRPYRVQYMTNQNLAIRLLKCVKSEWTIIGNGPYRCVSLGFASCTLQWFLLYASKDPSQDIALAMSLLLGWIFVLFFTRGCRVTCRFSLMIQNLFLSDLIYFLTVYSIVLVGFSFAMNAMFTYMGDAEIAISKVFYDMMNVVTDLDQKQSTDESRHYLFTKLLLIVYAIVAVILLLNMLIAMMNTSYEIVTVTRCNLWKQQQLSIMLMIERRLFWLKALCRGSEEGIWTEGDGHDPRYFMDVTMLHSSKDT